MRAVIVALSLLGTALAAPADLASETCTKKSSGVRSWKAKNFDFHASYIFSTPAHQNSWGYVNFTLENPVIPGTALCSTASNQLQDFFYVTVDYQCQFEREDSPTHFRYSRPTGQLEIKQDWTCPGEESRFSARGDVRLDLRCNETKWEKPALENGPDILFSSHHLRYRFRGCPYY